MRGTAHKPLPVIAASSSTDIRAAAAPLVPVVVLMWLVAAGVAVAADGYERAPWWLLVLNQLVLVPATAWATLALGRSLGARGVAVLAAALLAIVPVLGVLYALSRYRETYVDRVLTVAVGIADGGRFPAAALSVVAAALALRSLGVDRPRFAAVLGGLAAGAAALVHPSAALVLVGIALAYAVAWRPVEAAFFGAAAVPAVAFAAASSGLALVVSWEAFTSNMAGLREYLWSNRVLQWLPLAGAIGAARGSLPFASLLAGWFGAFAVVYGASPQAHVEDGSFLVAFVPAGPAFCLLVACIPLLLPTLLEHLRKEVKARDVTKVRPNRDTPASAGRPDL